MVSLPSTVVFIKEARGRSAPRRNPVPSGSRIAHGKHKVCSSQAVIVGEVLTRMPGSEPLGWFHLPGVAIGNNWTTLSQPPHGNRNPQLARLLPPSLPSSRTEWRSSSCTARQPSTCVAPSCPQLSRLLQRYSHPLSRADEAGYRFSPVNQYDIKLTAAYWNPIINYVSEQSGVKLNLKIGRTSADTTSYVLAQEVEFVFSNHLFSPEREKLGWKVFGHREMAPVHGLIVVPADSSITDISQLQGQL